MHGMIRWQLEVVMPPPVLSLDRSPIRTRWNARGATQKSALNKVSRPPEGWRWAAGAASTKATATVWRELDGQRLQEQAFGLVRIS